MTKLAIILLLALPATAVADKTFNGAKGSWNCKKDPTVFINHGKGKYTFKGPCTSISVNGGMNKLKIESVDALSLNGAANVVDVGTVASITISGTNNVVTWKKAKSGDEPTVDADTPATTTVKRKE